MIKVGPFEIFKFGTPSPYTGIIYHREECELLLANRDLVVSIDGDSSWLELTLENVIGVAVDLEFTDTELTCYVNLIDDKWLKIIEMTKPHSFGALVHCKHNHDRSQQQLLKIVCLKFRNPLQVLDKTP